MTEITPKQAISCLEQLSGLAQRCDMGNTHYNQVYKLAIKALRLMEWTQVELAKMRQAKKGVTP